MPIPDLSLWSPTAGAAGYGLCDASLNDNVSLGDASFNEQLMVQYLNTDVSGALWMMNEENTCLHFNLDVKKFAEKITGTYVGEGVNSAHYTFDTLDLTNDNSDIYSFTRVTTHGKICKTYAVPYDTATLNNSLDSVTLNGSSYDVTGTMPIFPGSPVDKSDANSKYNINIRVAQKPGDLYPHPSNYYIADSRQESKLVNETWESSTTSGSAGYNKFSISMGSRCNFGPGRVPADDTKHLYYSIDFHDPIKVGRPANPVTIDNILLGPLDCGEEIQPSSTDILTHSYNFASQSDGQELNSEVIAELNNIHITHENITAMVQASITHGLTGGLNMTSDDDVRSFLIDYIRNKQFNGLIDHNTTTHKASSCFELYGSDLEFSWNFMIKINFEFPENRGVQGHVLPVGEYVIHRSYAQQLQLGTEWQTAMDKTDLVVDFSGQCPPISITGRHSDLEPQNYNYDAEQYASSALHAEANLVYDKHKSWMKVIQVPDDEVSVGSGIGMEYIDGINDILYTFTITKAPEPPTPPIPNLQLLSCTLKYEGTHALDIKFTNSGTENIEKNVNWSIYEAFTSAELAENQDPGDPNAADNIMTWVHGDIRYYMLSGSGKRYGTFIYGTGATIPYTAGFGKYPDPLRPDEVAIKTIANMSQALTEGVQYVYVLDRPSHPLNPNRVSGNITEIHDTAYDSLGDNYGMITYSPPACDLGGSALVLGVPVGGNVWKTHVTFTLTNSGPGDCMGYGTSGKNYNKLFREQDNELLKGDSLTKLSGDAIVQNDGWILTPALMFGQSLSFTLVIDTPSTDTDYRFEVDDDGDEKFDTNRANNTLPFTILGVPPPTPPDLGATITQAQGDTGMTNVIVNLENSGQTISKGYVEYGVSYGDYHKLFRGNPLLLSGSTLLQGDSLQFVTGDATVYTSGFIKTPLLEGSESLTFTLAIETPSVNTEYRFEIDVDGDGAPPEQNRTNNTVIFMVQGVVPPTPPDLKGRIVSQIPDARGKTRVTVELENSGGTTSKGLVHNGESLGDYHMVKLADGTVVKGDSLQLFSGDATVYYDNGYIETALLAGGDSLTFTLAIETPSVNTDYRFEIDVDRYGAPPELITTNNTVYFTIDAPPADGSITIRTTYYSDVENLEGPIFKEDSGAVRDYAILNGGQRPKFVNGYTAVEIKSNFTIGAMTWLIDGWDNDPGQNVRTNGAWAHVTTVASELSPSTFASFGQPTDGGYVMPVTITSGLMPSTEFSTAFIVPGNVQNIGIQDIEDFLGFPNFGPFIFHPHQIA